MVLWPCDSMTTFLVKKCHFQMPIKASLFYQFHSDVGKHVLTVLYIKLPKVKLFSLHMHFKAQNLRRIRNQSHNHLPLKWKPKNRVWIRVRCSMELESEELELFDFLLTPFCLHHLWQVKIEISEAESQAEANGLS